MLKKIIISKNFGYKNNLYLSNIIVSGIARNKRLLNLFSSNNSTYFFNLKSNLC